MGVAETIAAAETKAKVAKEMSCMIVKDMEVGVIWKRPALEMNASDVGCETCSEDYRRIGEGLKYLWDLVLADLVT